MFPPIRTGTANCCYRLAQELSSQGVDVTIVTVATGEPSEKLLDEESSFQVIRLASKAIPLPGFFKHFRLACLFPQNYAVVSGLAADKPDGIILVNQYQDVAFLALWLGYKAKAPITAYIGTQIQASNPFVHWILRKLDRLICGPILTRCQHIACMDHEIRRYIEDVHGEAFRDRTAIVPYGVGGDPEAYQRRFQRGHAAERSGQLVGVGALTDFRNFVPVIRIFNEMLKISTRPLRLKIMGHVYKLDAVHLARKLGIEHSIEFTGELSQEQVAKEVAQSELCFGITTGYYYGLGCAVLEAMLAGVPVAGNAPGNLFEHAQLRDLQEYIHVDTQHPYECAQKLIKLLDDGAAMNRIGVGGQRFVQEQLNWELVARMHRALFADQPSSINQKVGARS